MISPEVLSIFIGLIVPAVTSFLKNPRWNRELKTALVVVVCAVGAVGGMLVTGDLTFDTNFWGQLGASAATVFTSATLFYNMYFKKTEVNKKLESNGVGSE